MIDSGLIASQKFRFSSMSGVSTIGGGGFDLHQPDTGGYKPKYPACVLFTPRVVQPTAINRTSLSSALGHIRPGLRRLWLAA